MWKWCQKKAQCLKTQEKSHFWVALMISLDGDFGVKISLSYVGHTLYCQYDTKWIIWDGVQKVWFFFVEISCFRDYNVEKMSDIPLPRFYTVSWVSAILVIRWTWLHRCRLELRGKWRNSNASMSRIANKTSTLTTANYTMAEP